MAEQKKDNRGYLYPNLNKNKPTQPDFTGKTVIEGKEWNIAAWENTTPEGKKYLSLSYSVPLPAGTYNKENQQPTNNQTLSQQQQNINKDLEDIEDILKSSGDDNPFDN